MNKNLPHAERIIRGGLSASGDIARAIAHALNGAGLLVDPERSYGTVLPTAPVLSDLEQQALAWDAACERARALVAHLQAEFAPERYGLQSVRPDGDRVQVTLHVTQPGQWAAFVRYLAIEEEPQQLEYAYVGHGHRDGVAVSVIAYDAPEVEDRALKAAAKPYRFGGQVYDLAVPHRDINREVWTLRSTRPGDGTPLLVKDGSSEPFPLPTVVEYVGPLTPMPLPTAGGAAA